MPNKNSEKLWIYLIVDFITKLLLGTGKNTILVVYDRLSKMTYSVATMEETSVEELVHLLRDNVWKLHGLPESEISDRKPQFIANLTRKLN